MAIGEVIKTEEHGGKPSLTIKWDQKPQGWGYKSMNDYGQVRHDLTQFHVGDMVDFEIEVLNFKGQSYDRIRDIKKVSSDNSEPTPQPTQKPNPSFNHGKNSEIQDEYLSLVNDAFSKLPDYANLKGLSEDNKKAVAIGSAIQQMRANGYR